MDAVEDYARRWIKREVDQEERHLTASWSLNTDLGRLLTQCLSL
jgi:hypothetical protein